MYGVEKAIKELSKIFNDFYILVAFSNALKTKFKSYSKAGDLELKFKSYPKTAEVKNRKKAQFNFPFLNCFLFNPVLFCLGIFYYVGFKDTKIGAFFEIFSLMSFYS